MSARDEVRRIIHTAHCLEVVHNEDCMFWEDDATSADAILAAGYREVVTTKADLDALPVGTKIRDNRSESLIKDESAMWVLTTHPNELFASWEMEFGLPAVVLLEGDAA